MIIAMPRKPVFLIPILLIALVILPFPGGLSGQRSQAASSAVSMTLQNDSGVPATAFTELVGRTSLAVRLTVPPASGEPIRLDTVRIYIEPQADNQELPLLIRLEAVENEAPANEDPLFTARLRLPLNQPGWIDIPIYYLFDTPPTDIIISFWSEDVPWAKPPLIMIDDSTQIASNRNFFGQSFSAWVEHYSYWPTPEQVGYLMVRAELTTGSDALFTPTPTPSLTPTSSPSPTITSSPTVTSSPTATPSPTASPTSQATQTPTPSATVTPTISPVFYTNWLPLIRQ